MAPTSAPTVLDARIKSGHDERALNPTFPPIVIAGLDPAIQLNKSHHR